MILTNLNEIDLRYILTKFYENSPIDVGDIDADGRTDGQTDRQTSDPKTICLPQKILGGDIIIPVNIAA